MESFLIVHVFMYPGEQLDGSEEILIDIVFVRLFYWKRRIAIARPSSAIVDGFIDSANLPCP